MYIPAGAVGGNDVVEDEVVKAAVNGAGRVQRSVGSREHRHTVRVNDRQLRLERRQLTGVLALQTTCIYSTRTCRELCGTQSTVK